MQDILKYDYEVNQTISDPDNPAKPVDPENQSVVDQIIQNINDKYGSSLDVSPVDDPSTYVGPSQFTDIFEIPDSELLEVDEEGNIVTETPPATGTPASDDAED